MMLREAMPCGSGEDMTALDKEELVHLYRKRAGRYNFTANLLRNIKKQAGFQPA
jgi:hypothetical protein